MRRFTKPLPIAFCAFGLPVIILLALVLSPASAHARASALPRAQIDTPDAPPPTSSDNNVIVPPSAPSRVIVPSRAPDNVVWPAGAGATQPDSLSAEDGEAASTLPRAGTDGRLSTGDGGDAARRMGFTAAGLLATPSQKALYTFRGMAGQNLTITVVRTRGTLDTFLELYDSNYPPGTRLAYNDDNPAAGERNSQIDSYRIGRTGTYKIVVSSYAGKSTGQFKLTVMESAANRPTLSSTPTPSSTPRPRATAAPAH